MAKKNVVIIGGSAGGIQAAIAVGRHQQVDNLTVIRKEEKVMIPCGIPYIFGTLDSVEKNVMPDALLGDAKLVIDEVVSINRQAQKVTTAQGKAINYDKLILVTGSQPAVPPIPGQELANVFTVQKDINHLQQLHQALGEAKDVVIIGGGFIGVEFADECKKRGLNVTIVELLPNCLFLNCDEAFCTCAEEELKKRGIGILCNNNVSAILGNHKVGEVQLASGERLKADLVILAIGVNLNTQLAQEADLELGAFKAISVDRYMQTSDPNILAAGDCCEKYSYFTHNPIGLRLASIATHEARLAAVNLFEPRLENPGAIGVFATKVGDLAITVTGLTEREAKEAGFDIVIGTSGAPDKHPGTCLMPAKLDVKLVFERESRKLIGGQVCGGTSAGEIANIIASAIGSGLTASQVVTMQIGTHPALTASPIAYQLINAAEKTFPYAEW